MRHILTAAIACVAVGIAAPAYAQAANDFPLAAAAGQDSGAAATAPEGSVNSGAFDKSAWQYGTAFAAPEPASEANIWNPVKLKLMRGEKVTGGTMFYGTDPELYCAMANAGYDYIWVEMQHSQKDWQEVARMWAACPHAKAVPGVRIAYTDEREIQHALDAGALVLILPTMDSAAEMEEARDWAFFPPMGRRSNGGGQAFTQAMYGGVPGGYRQTINDNLVVIPMIETLDGIAEAAEIAKVPGVAALFAASGDLGNFTGYKQGDPDYERVINIVHDAAIGAGVRLCGPFSWKDRPDFTCFQNTNDLNIIARGVKDELGDLVDTQAKPAVGPWAAK
ncbi:MAG TPA: aldolase/citrate lyase family protein [Devosia sp.]|nr:aldolase/citrate lyase family protein [Devosia sp.]